MAVQKTMGIQRVWGEGAYHDPVTLYDDVDGMAFGPTFKDTAEANAFLRWFDKETGGAKPSSLTADKWSADKWRAFLADHDEAECPYDSEDAGVGFMGDRDASDGSGAWTPRCQCECHDKARKGEVR